MPKEFILRVTQQSSSCAKHVWWCKQGQASWVFFCNKELSTYADCELNWVRKSNALSSVTVVFFLVLAVEGSPEKSGQVNSPMPGSHRSPAPPSLTVFDSLRQPRGWALCSAPCLGTLPQLPGAGGTSVMEKGVWGALRVEELQKQQPKEQHAVRAPAERTGSRNAARLVGLAMSWEKTLRKPCPSAELTQEEGRG